MQFRFTALPPLALYVHIPWCVRKCPYCDFNSHEARDGIPERDYIAALIADLEQELPDVWGRPLGSVFIGGGTPSLFSAEAIDTLLSAIRARLPLPPNAEITLEANPGTVEAGRFREFRAAGINRLSIGIQSFQDALLPGIGRIHDAAQARGAAEIAHGAGFDNLNLDLMYGLPGQDLAQALADIDTAIELAPTHISHYQLTLEPNTAFHHTPPPLPEDEDLWAMQEACQTRLAAAGYGQYEVSAYAKDQRRCWHNLNYWQFGDYLGIGAGAHGKISSAQHQSVTRRWKQRHPRDYQANAATPARIAGEQQLTAQEAGLEFMMYAMRLNDGVPTWLFSAHSGVPISVIETQLKQAEQRGLLEWNIHHLRPTALGRHFLNDLLALFL